MRIHKNYQINKLRELGDQLERSGVADEALKAINNFDGSYKSAMELCGKLTVIADMSTFDDYWLEQVNRGVSTMTDSLCEVSRKINEPKG